MRIVRVFGAVSALVVSVCAAGQDAAPPSAAPAAEVRLPEPTPGILSGLYPRVYAKAGGMIVFPLDTDNDNDAVVGTQTDDLVLRSELGGGWYGAAGLRFAAGPRGDDAGVGLRVEGEFAQRFFDTDGLFIDNTEFRDLDGDLEVTTIIGNVLLDITADDFRGYGGIGIGYADVDASVNGVSDSDSGVAVQFPFGIETRLVPHVWLDVGCRLLFVPSLDSMSDLDEYSVVTVELFAGITLEL
jgi:opacity protein-like surface antigen